MFQDIGNPRTPGFGGFSFFESGFVADVGVEGEVSDEFAGGLVDHSDVEVVDDDHDGCSVECPSEADVVRAAGTAE